MKKVIYYITLLILPFLFLILIEGVLILFNVGEQDVEVFIEDELNPSHLILNPEIAKRYFQSELITVKGERDSFLKRKDDNSIRIVIQGASSVQGFPYGNSISAPRLLKANLKELYPEKNIEVINLGITAVSSYVLRDMAKAISNISPDAVIIYSGHNEFYGVYGAASSQSATAKRFITNSFLYLKRFRVFRTLLGVLSSNDTDEFDPNKTLMEKMALNQRVPYNSEIFETTKHNYIENLSDIIDIYKSNMIPTILSNLVYNLKDQPPFLSDAIRIPNLDRILKEYSTAGKLDTDLNLFGGLLQDHPENALLHYLVGRIYYKHEDFETAGYHFSQSHKYDNLRFRIPNEYNESLKELALKKKIHFVDMFSAFRNYSKGSIIGNELILEHVHPSIIGYNYMAYNFLLALANADVLPKYNEIENISFQLFNQRSYLSTNKLDSIKGHVTINALLSNWPFNLYDSIFSPPQIEYQPSYELDITLDVIASKISHYNASLLLCEFYLKNGDFTSLLRVANSLDLEWNNRPRINFYQVFAYSQLDQKDKAKRITALLNERYGYDFVKTELGKLQSIYNQEADILLNNIN